MSYFIITHPRSGSSNLCVAISKIMSETSPTWNLDEFFHPGNFQLWGDFKKILVSGLDQGIVFSVKKLDNNTIWENTWYVKNVCKNILKETNIKKSDLILWKNQEMKKRLDFVQTLYSVNQSFLIKIFLDSDIWLNYKFTTDNSLILYRKNFTDAILSMLIKNYYYSNVFSYDNFNDRYKGREFSVPNFSFEVSYHDFLLQTNTFFRFLEFCNIHRNIKFVSYEELYNDSSSVDLFGKRLSKTLLDDIDTKLEYYKEKKTYIRNIQQVNSWIISRLKDKKLEDICKILMIHNE